MCELLGMNCNVPTDIVFSFTGFCERGGRTADHVDGWGIGFFEGRGCRVFLDVAPACESPVAKFVKTYPIKTLTAIAHIRKATHGAVALENTHPFVREVWGRYWLFAHNGSLEAFTPALSGRFVPVGDTDSERAFCAILDAFAARGEKEMPPLEKLYQTLAEVTAWIASHGKFNYLLGSEHFLFAYCATSLHYLIRQAPFRTAHLADADVTVDFSSVTTPKDRVAIIATRPLTDNEEWVGVAPGSLVLFQDGEVVMG
ncbi:MAG: class II glutamine amidotransferase [bacterium]|nr:class II glutamine amidotransferase [bacterium]